MQNQKSSQKVERVIAYIDGFNLYFGMLDGGFDYCKWLNIQTLIESRMKEGQNLTKVKYFTSSVSNDPGKQKRQVTYIEALQTTGVEIFYGRYQINDVECHRCHHIWREPNEKMTDVNIATQLLLDAYQDNYDTAILVSGDSDLVPPIKAVHENFPNKRIVVFFPPSRYNQSVAAVSKGNMVLGRKTLVSNQFPPEVTKASGFILRKPTPWI